MDDFHTELVEWIRRFQELHERAKRGALGPDLVDYHASRDRVARTMLAAQYIALQPGQKPRRMLRAARPVQAELEFQGARVSARTITLSAGGFAVLLVHSPSVGEYVKVVLSLPEGRPLHAQARVLSLKKQVPDTRVDFAFVGDSTDVERIELFVFDTLLAELES